MTELARKGAVNETRSQPKLTIATVFGCALFAALWTIYPFARSTFRLQVGYNEGWNIYTTQRLVHHLQLYPEAYGWQSVNYPILSFALLALLHRLTHEYLFTARVVSLLSLLASCTLCGILVRQLSGSRLAAILSAFLCLGIFSTDADQYVGMDDPQLLAQTFFLLALSVYLRDRRSLSNLALTAALVVFAASIKHNMLEFPLAILCDLSLLSWRRALWFTACASAFASFSLALNLHFGGPYFLAQLLAPRVYDLPHGLQAVALGVLLPLIAPLALAIVVAAKLRIDPRRRIAALLLAFSLLIGTLFAGGRGVSTNTYFGTMIAISLLLGLFLSDLEGTAWTWMNYRILKYTPQILFAWLLVPAGCNGLLNLAHLLGQLGERQRRFTQETAFLKQQPSPQLCEDLLLCFYAGQPYLYDPFNATRLIQTRKLDPQPFLQKLNQGSFGIIQLDQHEPDDTSQADRFPASFRTAIAHHYHPVLTTPEAVFYEPNTSP